MSYRDTRVISLTEDYVILGNIKFTVMPPAAKCSAYGRPQNPAFTRFVAQQGYEQTRKVLGHKIYTFSVPDDPLGIRTVVLACGFGFPRIKQEDDCVTEYAKLGISWRKDGLVTFRESAVAISPQTRGYRAVWGLEQRAFIGTVYINSTDEAKQIGRRHDVYQLLPNLPSGGILLQSSFSGAIIEASKVGDMWILRLLLPITDHGECAGDSYGKIYLDAYDYFISKHSRTYHRRLVS